ncbi:hypothetical protein HNQ64_003554 [Prosthecobacter dejongeii]|uniref:Uncharacterized protein n=1 Tax=Prosthecobacter dejongeii TaxID=48465 RepID=A0A7W7YNK5_9BACT|nr:hypothetical protein [Prosthecobacter dejongeii]
MSHQDFLFKITQGVCLTLALAFTTSCGKKSQIIYEAEQKRLTMMELQGQSKKLESEILATGNLGRYQNTQPSHVVELKHLLERQKTENIQLKADKEAAQKRVEAVKQEMSRYLTQFR